MWTQLVWVKLRTNSVCWLVVKRFGMHTLTRESQEVTAAGLIVPKLLPPTSSEILWTDIPHSGQLNNTISTLLTPVKLSVPEKFDVITAGLEGIVSSWLAHISASSPVSVGMFLSNRTLEVGSRQVDVLSSLFVVCEQLPLTNDPFTNNFVSTVGKMNRSG